MDTLERFKAKVITATSISYLKKNVVHCEETIVACQRRLSSIHRDFLEAESNLIHAKELKRKAEEALFLHTESTDDSSFTDDVREQQIQEYREKMPKLLKEIENEKPLKYRAMGEIGTIERQK